MGSGLSGLLGKAVFGGYIVKVAIWCWRRCKSALRVSDAYAGPTRVLCGGSHAGPTRVLCGSHAPPTQVPRYAGYAGPARVLCGWVLFRSKTGPTRVLCGKSHAVRDAAPTQVLSGSHAGPTCVLHGSYTAMRALCGFRGFTRPYELLSGSHAGFNAGPTGSRGTHAGPLRVLRKSDAGSMLVLHGSYAGL